MDAFAVAIPVGSGLLGVAVAWGAMLARVRTITAKLTEHEERIDEHRRKFEKVVDDVNERKLEAERLTGKILVLRSDLDSRTYDYDKLYAETRGQTEMMMDIQKRLGRATVDTPTSGLRGGSGTVVAARPPQLPPMRPRAKSYRAEQE